MGRRIRARGLLAAVMATAALAACGSSGSSASSGASSSRPAAPVSTLPPPQGEPIVVAMIAQESGPAALPDSRLAAEAAVKYVNTELGGAAGRPVQLETCITDGSPEQSSACANQLLEKHPVAFVGESELGTAGSVPIIETAGVPLVGAAGITPELVLSHDAFAFGLDAVGDWSGWTKYLATDGNAKTINLINIDIPAAPVFEKAVRSVAEANGAKVDKVVSLPLSATDVSAQMAAASEGNPDVIMAVVSAQLCVPAAQAHESIAPQTKLFLPGICSSPQTISAAGSSMDGALVGVGSLNPYDTGQPDVATYRRALDTYGDHVPLSQFAGNAFTAVMNLKAVVDKLGPTGVTADAITNAIKAGTNVQSFMTDTYTCDGKVPLSPGTCVRGRRVLEVKSGQLSNLSDQWFDGTGQVSVG
ncbi:MAG TPA: ABC transporter substrate-binding protein [Acidimicrobiales bacterium]|jgi:branched-chain amino acid transport system substrate-binding protein|nr:ABC transporter substrate-binding protein [Acidimicrobiales bacterium]